MKIVGVTGGIGSGKTVFCKEMEACGAFVIYADDFAKQLMGQNQDLREKIIQTFGDRAYRENGELNRSYLAKEAFENDRVEELNRLVHPLLWQKIKVMAEEKEAEGFPLFVVEAAILLNKGRPKFIDYVILLQSDVQKRVNRVEQRDKASKNEILGRMKKQPDFEQLSHLSEAEVINNGSLEDLKQQARILFFQLKKDS